LRNHETNVVGKEKEDGSENGSSEVVNVGDDVLDRYGSGANGRMRRTGVS
jgi:hypothetical protein